ncbi:MAG TPA: glycoside hydrolase domain-containing protein [Candidatus Acidoferrum sp.]|nr:glycoside hydrolase domain-containing protein [Candidatus Acidoferrum sp.]
MTSPLCLFLPRAFCGLCVESFSSVTRAVTLLLVALFVANPASTAQQAPQHYYLGFDRNDYPGDEAMKLLRRDFAFTGYWLGNPPEETTNSWTGKREFLRSQGFGFVLLFAGPASGQLLDEAYTRKRVADDTQTAVAAARREGFSAGSVIFLDIEEGGRLPSTYVTYLKTWASELERLGFRAGVYCSAIPVDEGGGSRLVTSDFIREQIKPAGLVYWVYNDSCPPSPGCSPPQDPPAPSKGGSAYAQIWQFVRSPRDKETARRCRGYAKDGNCYAALDAAHRFHLDLNSATSPDPSGTAK